MKKMTNRQKVLKKVPGATLEYNSIKDWYYIKSQGIIGVGKTSSDAWKSARMNIDYPSPLTDTKPN